MRREPDGEDRARDDQLGLGDERGWVKLDDFSEPRGAIRGSLRVARDRREGQVGLEHLVDAFRNSFVVLERAEGWIRVEHGGHLREKAAGAW